MSTPLRLPTASVAFVALVCAALAGCVSDSRCGKQPPKEAGTGVATKATSWWSGALDRKEIGESPYGAHASSGNPALRSVDPWLGAVGMTFGVHDDYEIGVGLCVPREFAETTEIERVQEVAVGVWLKFDF